MGELVVLAPTEMLAPRSASVQRRNNSLIASASSDARYIQNRRDEMEVASVPPSRGRGMVDGDCALML